MRRILTICLLIAGFVLPAAAATVDGVTLPETFSVDGHSLVMNGIGVRTLTIFSVRIYVAALYLPAVDHDPAHIMASPGPKVILLHFLHSGSKTDVEKEFRAGEATNCGGGGCDPADKGDFEKLVAAAPAVEVGDTSTYIFTDRGVRVLANGRVIGDFNNRDLARLLLAGFIGPHPPSESLRAHLLGTETD